MTGLQSSDRPFPVPLAFVWAAAVLVGWILLPLALCVLCGWGSWVLFETILGSTKKNRKTRKKTGRYRNKGVGWERIKNPEL